jgi:hypothetical protein
MDKLYDLGKAVFTAQVVVELRQLADDLENGKADLGEYTRETIDFDPPEYMLIRFDRTE